MDRKGDVFVDTGALYEKLRPYLEVVKPWGCYVPTRCGRNNPKDWPLSRWKGPGHSPLCVRWNPHGERKPTYEQFLAIYPTLHKWGGDDV